MLILTRKPDESIIINDNIEVKVLRVQGTQVQLGIAAPREVPVYRQEIHEQVMEENRRAMQIERGTLHQSKLQGEPGGAQDDFQE